MADNAELSKIAQQQADLTGTWDDRHRIFNEMRNPNLSDDERKELTDAYKKAIAAFEAARKAITA